MLGRGSLDSVGWTPGTLPPKMVQKEAGMRGKAVLEEYNLEVLPFGQQPTGVIGRVVTFAGRRTSTIVEVHAATKTIRTSTGSYYVLGRPTSACQQTHPQLLQELGF